MPLTNSLYVNQKLVFARIEIAAAREIQELALSENNSIEDKLRQHAHLDSALNQLASAFDFFVLERTTDLQMSEQETEKTYLMGSNSWLRELLAARDEPGFIAARFALVADQQGESEAEHASNLIASVSVDKEYLAPIALLSGWSKEMQKMVDQYRTSLLEE